MNHTIIAANPETFAGENLKDFTGIAYAGGKISQHFGKTVIDLQGLEIAPQIPLLYNHVNEPLYRLGVCEVTVVDGQILVSGKIDNSTRQGAQLVKAGQQIPWQLSIGAAGREGYELAEGATATVNGNEIEGPCLVFTKAILREISVVAVGADEQTEMQIAAAFSLEEANITAHEAQPDQVEAQEPTPEEEPKVEESEVTPEESKDEEAKDEEEPKVEAKLSEEQIQANLILDRQVKFRELIEANGEADLTIKNYLLQALCSDTTTIDEAKAFIQAYADLQKASQVSIPNLIVTKKEKTMDNQTISAALMQTVGVGENQILATYGEQTIQAAQAFRGMTLKDAVIHAAQIEGKTLTGFNGDPLVQAAFSTVSLPGILESVIRASLLKGFNQVDAIWKKFCSTTSLPDFKKSTYYRVDGFNRLAPVHKGGEIKSMALSETSASNQVTTVGGHFSVTRADIINDNLQALADIPRKFGVAAAREIDIAVANLLAANPTMDDNQRLFSTRHGNIASSASALSATSLEEARTKFLRQKDSQGNIIYARPRYLVVPPELEATAVNLTQSLEITGAQSEKGRLNVASLYGLQVIVNPYLTNTTGWFLLAAPEELNTIEVAFLNGIQTPVISGPFTNIDTDGFGWKATFDYGVAPITYQGGFYNAGA